MLKVGDLVGVGVNEFAHDDDDDDKKGFFPEDRHDLIPTTAVFFKVSRIEGAESVGDGLGLSWEARAARGEFGYVVDPEVTVLVQAGLVHQRGAGGSFGDWLGIRLFSFLSIPFFLRRR